MSTISDSCAVILDEIERGVNDIILNYSTGSVELEALLTKADRLSQWALAVCPYIAHGEDSEDLLSSIIAIRESIINCLQEGGRHM